MDLAGWTIYDAQFDLYAEGTYDYYSSTTNDQGVTTTTYRNADGSVWSVVDSWSDDAGHDVTRTINSQGTQTASYSIDGEHYYITDLTTGVVTITPETFGEIMVDEDGDDIVHYRHEGQDVYLFATVDVAEDVIIMDGLDEEQNEVNAFIPRSAPWNAVAVDGQNQDILNVLAAEFDTEVNGTYESIYQAGTFELDQADHNQNGEEIIEAFASPIVEEFDTVYDMDEHYYYTERTYESVTASAQQYVEAV